MDKDPNTKWKPKSQGLYPLSNTALPANLLEINAHSRTHPRPSPVGGSDAGSRLRITDDHWFKD